MFLSFLVQVRMCAYIHRRTNTIEAFDFKASTAKVVFEQIPERGEGSSHTGICEASNIETSCGRACLLGSRTSRRGKVNEK